KIQRCSGSSCSPVTTIASGQAGLTYGDTGLTPGTIYRYTIVATNSVGDGAASAASINATTLVIPAAVTTPTFGVIAATSIVVNWTAAANATGYSIKRATDSAMTLNVVTFTVGNVLTYSDNVANSGANAPAANTTYYYEIAGTTSSTCSE